MKTSVAMPGKTTVVSPTLSGHAWAQLDQFRRAPDGLIWAGDLIDKEGKRELMALGLVAGQDGDYYLTRAGRELAARMGADGWHGSERNQ